MRTRKKVKEEDEASHPQKRIQTYKGNQDWDRNWELESRCSFPECGQCPIRRKNGKLISYLIFVPSCCFLFLYLRVCVWHDREVWNEWASEWVSEGLMRKRGEGAAERRRQPVAYYNEATMFSACTQRRVASREEGLSRSLLLLLLVLLVPTNQPGKKLTFS